MTKRELMLRTLAKVTNQPRAHLLRVIEFLEAPPENLDKELSHERCQQLQADFENETSGILAWYVNTLREHPELARDRVDAIQKENQAMINREKRF